MWHDVTRMLTRPGWLTGMQAASLGLQWSPYTEMLGQVTGSPLVGGDRGHGDRRSRREGGWGLSRDNRCPLGERVSRGGSG